MQANVGANSSKLAEHDTDLETAMWGSMGSRDGGI